MPRRERNREIARRRKRKKESKKLRAKGLSSQPAGSIKENEKKKLEKVTTSETPPEVPKEITEPSTTEN